MWQKLFRKDISLKVDTKDGVITITATSQDPLISKTIADSLRTKLKEFITAYRTDKARKDVAYYKKLTQEALSSYEDARSDMQNSLMLIKMSFYNLSNLKQKTWKMICN